MECLLSSFFWAYVCGLADFTGREEILGDLKILFFFFPQAVSYEEYFRQIFGLSGSKKIVENIPRKYYLGNMGSVLRFRNIFFCF